MPLNPSTACRVTILELAIAYTKLSLDIEHAAKVALKKGDFKALIDQPIDLNSITDTERAEVGKLVTHPVLRGVIEMRPEQPLWFSSDSFLDVLLAAELVDTPLPKELLLPVEDLAEGIEPSLEVFAEALDTSVYRDLVNLLSVEENHQQQYDQTIVTLALAAVRHGKITGNLETIFAERQKQSTLVFEYTPKLERCRPRDDVDPPEPPAKPPEEEIIEMPDTPEQLGEIANSISRLQDTMLTAAAPASGGSSRNFDTMLNELQYSTLSIPALDSEAALTMGLAKLSDKIFKNLSQAVKVTPGAEGDRYTFHPRYIRTIDYSGIGARGGAAVIALEVEATRTPFVMRMRDLEPEDCICEERDAEELITLADDLLAQLAQEAAADTGPFKSRVNSLLDRLMDTVLELTMLYGIKLEKEQLLGSKQTKEIYDRSRKRTKGAVSDGGGGGRLEVGILTEDANDEAFKALLSMIDRLVVLFNDPDGTQLGATFARLMKRIDAIPPSVADIRRALRTAGVSLVDQKASFTWAADDSPYELDRLLSWIDDSAGGWHGDLMDGTATRRELRWMHQSIKDMATGLAAFETNKGASTPFGAATPDNPFSAARRQIRELMGLLDTAGQDAHSLMKSPR